MMPQKHENMNYDHSVANLSQPLPGEAKGGGHKVLTVFPSPLCSLRNLFLCQHDSKNIPTHGSLWRPSSSAQQVFWIRNSMNKMASILPSAYVRHGHSCTDVACWHLLSVFPVSYVGELPLRVVERAHHTLPENTHFTPTLLRLAVHAEIMSTFAFRETFCRLASPQTRSVWQGNKARWPSLSCSGHSPPTHLCLSFPISHHFLVFFSLSLSCGKSNFPLECLSLYVMSPTFLGMSWEEFWHCSRMRLQVIPQSRVSGTPTRWIRPTAQWDTREKPSGQEAVLEALSQLLLPQCFFFISSAARGCRQCSILVGLSGWSDETLVVKTASERHITQQEAVAKNLAMCALETSRLLTLQGTEITHSQKR